MTVEILNEFQRKKDDNNDDSIFYANPRFVNHLDDAFIRRLKNLYRERLASKSVVLDLMSSWNSHLPNEIKYKKVLGHGLNAAELEANKRLDSYWVQDLNKNQTLPLKDNSVDFCVMVAAWQYLQYPERLAFELKRVVKPQGELIVSFSNRAFWTKSPRIWIDESDMGRINYIKRVLHAQGWSTIKHIYEKNDNQGILPFLGGGDPFLAVIASNI